SGSRGTGQLTFTVIDPRGQTMLTSVSSVELRIFDEISYASAIPSNALNGQYTVTATLTYQGQTTANRASFTVAGGTDTPTIGVEALSTLTSSQTPQIGFRPGARVRFMIPTSNFTDQTLTSSLTYRLLGPANFSLPLGSKTIIIPTGLSSQAVDIDIPSSAPQGLYLFQCYLAAGAVTLTKTATITVVPRTPADGVTIDTLFLTDDN